MKFNKETQEQLVKISKEKGVFLEGNILKVIEKTENEEFNKFIDDSILRDKDSRSKRLEITKQIQIKNKDLVETKGKLEDSLKKVEKAKKDVEQDLDILRRKTQYQLIKQVVGVALLLVVGIGITTTGIYILTMFLNQDTEIIRNMWSSMFGIILTNSFSIIGTIMGIKYATEEKKQT